MLPAEDESSPTVSCVLPFALVVGVSSNDSEAGARGGDVEACGEGRAGGSVAVQAGGGVPEAAGEGMVRGDDEDVEGGCEQIEAACDDAGRVVASAKEECGLATLESDERRPHNAAAVDGDSRAALLPW